MMPINVSPIGSNTPKFDVIVSSKGENIELVKVKPVIASINDRPFSSKRGILPLLPVLSFVNLLQSFLIKKSTKKPVTKINYYK